MRAGIYPDMDGFAENWALDQRFTPKMDADTRKRRFRGWQDAVSRTLSR
jgi:glycerol kinase